MESNRLAKHHHLNYLYEQPFQALLLSCVNALHLPQMESLLDAIWSRRCFWRRNHCHPLVIPTVLLLPTLLALRRFCSCAS